ncbi:MAG TPA: hypothetical protein VFM95_07730 [Microcella sp.]|nr:hypothetical protein [Microcella sp.]
MYDISGFAPFGLVAFLLFFVLYGGLAVLFFWLRYQAIWRGVARGLREFYGRAGGAPGDGADGGADGVSR